MNKAIWTARVLLLFISAWVAAFSQAETLVLIPGYLGDGDDWRDSGITRALKDHGWSDAGSISVLRGWTGPRHGKKGGGPKFYTLSLESEAPLFYQERQLSDVLDLIIRRNPGEPLTLVGHSAGGVLGRLYMVKHPDAPVRALITIASPHLGTDAVELGLMAGQTPLRWISGIFGADTLNRSQGLYVDLAREYPGNLLFWLNRQPHPEARYISVVRSADLPLFGDLVVPAESQDMNRVAALRGRAVRLDSSGGHGLAEGDGELLVRILRRLRGG
jgi:pimeloyl-ACP methyl ester carboxylesterase